MRAHRRPDGGVSLHQDFRPLQAGAGDHVQPLRHGPVQRCALAGVFKQGGVVGLDRLFRVGEAVGVDNVKLVGLAIIVLSF